MQSEPIVERRAHVLPHPDRAFTIVSVEQRESGIRDCVLLDIHAKRAGQSRRMVLHCRGDMPSVGDSIQRKRRRGGIAAVWARSGTTEIVGGGFTTAAVPDVWR
ncbi:hypothetical protein [Pelagibacterium sp.]|uniref:hypothetical protein n=1 Tax=Pelagibacterium sp. TaxID=1967288 RepID=UPI003A8FE6D2